MKKDIGKTQECLLVIKEREKGNDCCAPSFVRKKDIGK